MTVLHKTSCCNCFRRTNCVQIIYSSSIIQIIYSSSIIQIIYSSSIIMQSGSRVAARWKLKCRQDGWVSGPKAVTAWGWPTRSKHVAL